MKLYSIKSRIGPDKDAQTIVFYSESEDVLLSLSETLHEKFNKSFKDLEEDLNGIKPDDVVIKISKEEVDNYQAEGVLYEVLKVKFKQEFKSYKEKVKTYEDFKVSILDGFEVKEASVFKDLEKDPNMKMVLAVGSMELFEYFKKHGLFEHHRDNIIGCCSESEVIRDSAIQMLKELGIGALDYGEKD